MRTISASRGLRRNREALLLTGVFNDPGLGGPGLVTDWVTVTMGYPGIGAQLWIQTKAVLLVTAWTAIVSFVSFYIVKAVVGLRVTEEQKIFTRDGVGITGVALSKLDGDASRLAGNREVAGLFSRGFRKTPAGAG